MDRTDNAAYALGVYEKAMPAALDWSDKLSAAKKSGYDWLEISIDETDEKLARLDWNISQKKELIQTMQENGIWIRSMCLSAHRRFPLGSKCKSTQKRSLEILRQAIAFCSFTGIRIIQLAGYDVYYEPSDRETKKIFMKNLNIACHMAAQSGVMLAFETMETPFMDTVRKAMDVIQTMNCPFLQLYPDIGNLSNAAHKYRHSLQSDLRTGKGHLAAMHLKETKPGYYRDLFYGEGCTDFSAVLPVLKEQGVCMFTAEFWHQKHRNWQQNLKDAAEFLRRELDAVYQI